MAALGYPRAKISLKEHDVPTLFQVVEAMLMSSIHRTRSPNTVNDMGSDDSVARIEGKQTSQADCTALSERYKKSVRLHIPAL